MHSTFVVSHNLNTGSKCKQLHLNKRDSKILHGLKLDCKIISVLSRVTCQRLARVHTATESIYRVCTIYNNIQRQQNKAGRWAVTRRNELIQLGPVVQSPIHANPGLTIKFLLRVNPALILLQWNLDLTNYQGTEEMRSLYRGFVKSKTLIYRICMKIIKMFVISKYNANLLLGISTRQR